MIGPELACLALTIYFEARSETTAGKVAVAQTVLQRVEDPRWPDSVCGVVYEPAQFSWYWDGKSDTPYEAHAWQESIILAGAVLAGSGHADWTATHYYAEYVRPVWRHALQVEVKIGKHIFLEG
jgi:spore germination cell wall hydrolase CwlJ-like protein